MLKKPAQLFFIFSFCAAVILPSLIFLPQQALAQDLSLGVSETYHVEGENLVDGSIVSQNDNGYRLSTEPYDKSMFGVLSKNPGITIEYEGTEGDDHIIRNGITSVRVNGENGPIKKGDVLTSSSTPGVAMKSTKTGFMLGVAQDDFTPTGADTDMVSVSLDTKLGFMEDSPQSETIGTRLIDVLRLSEIALTEEPSVVFRYVVAAGVIIGTLIFTFLTFSRNVLNGVQALGRNPIASSSIMMGMIFNVLISLAILGAGLGSAYFIISW